MQFVKLIKSEPPCHDSSVLGAETTENDGPHHAPSIVSDFRILAEETAPSGAQADVMHLAMTQVV